MHLVARAVSQSHPLRLQQQRPLSTEMSSGYVCYPAANLGPGGNQHLAALHYIRRYAAPKRFASLGKRTGEVVQQTNTNHRSLTQSSRRKRLWMDDIAIRIRGSVPCRQRGITLRSLWRDS